MAAPYIDTTALANLVQAAYDRKVRLALRLAPKFRDAINVNVVDQTAPGSSVTLNIHKNLAKAITPLNEITEPAGTTIGNTTPVVVTLNEYGNYSVVTRALRAFALDNDLDGNLANILAYNIVDSVDTVIETIFAAGTQYMSEIAGVRTLSGAAASVTATDLLLSRDIRYAVTKLRGAGVPTFDGENYLCYLHPDVALDLRQETGLVGWVYPQVYNSALQAKGILAGEIGTFNNVRFVETPRCSRAASGVAGAYVYQTYVFGADAAVEALVEDFHIVVNGVVVDPLNRKMTMGWYGIAGWALFRPESLWRIQTSSSVATS